MKSSISIALSVLALSACGGGSSDSGSSGTDVSVSLPGTPLTASEFADLLISGRYRYDISVETNYTVSIEDMGTTYTITSSGEAGVRGVLTAIINSSSSAITNSCDLEGPETIDPSEFGIEDDDLDFANCEISYSQISATEFGIAQVCPDLITDIDIVSSGTIELVSNDTSFDNGSLLIDNTSAITVDPITSNTEVCGYIAELDTQTTINPPLIGFVDAFDLNQTDVTIVAPYLSGQLIQANITFAKAELTSGTYSIDELPTDGIPANVAEMSFASPYFGGTASDPDFVFATSGTVTVTSASDDVVNGSFDITLDTFESVTGSFSVDLN